MSYPSHYTVEPVTGCNLRCPMCACGLDRLGRPHEHMTLEAYRVIAEQLRAIKSARAVVLHNWGEPTLNKHLPEMMELTQSFATPCISTNGCTAADWERLARTWSDIVVSVDGMTQQTYELYRRGGDIEKAMNALLTVLAARQRWLWQQRANGLRRPPRTVAQFLLFAHNQHEVADFAALMGAMRVVCEVKIPRLYERSPGVFAHTIPDFPQRLAPDSQSMRRCAHVRNNPVILVNGDVVPCCYDYQAKMVFGNVYEKSIAEIWDSESYRSFRECVLSGCTPSFCLENCMDSPSECMFRVEIKYEEKK